MIYWPAIIKSLSHFLTSGLLGTIIYILLTKLKIKDEKVKLSVAIFFAVLLHIYVDYKLGWF